MVRITGSVEDEKSVNAPTGESLRSVVRRKIGNSANRISGTDSKALTKTPPTATNAPRNERLLSRDNREPEGIGVPLSKCPASSTMPSPSGTPIPSGSRLSLESRRSFLGALVAVGGVFVSALLSVPLIRFALFPLLRRTTDLKDSPVGALTDFSSSTEPVMRTIQIEQVDGWRKVVTEKAVYVTKDSQAKIRVLTSIYPHLTSTSPWNKQHINL